MGAWAAYDHYDKRSAGHSRRESLQEQIRKLQNEQQAKLDARKALTPDFWEIHRQAGDDDKYRLLEQTWSLRHQTVQLSSSPRYETVFPSKDEWSLMVDDLRSVAAPKKRRLIKKPVWAK